VDHFYRKKPRAVDHLIQQFEKGQPILKADIKEALNNFTEPGTTRFTDAAHTENPPTITRED
jgi:hypothetical protein